MATRETARIRFPRQLIPCSRWGCNSRLEDLEELHEHTSENHVDDGPMSPAYVDYMAEVEDQRSRSLLAIASSLMAIAKQLEAAAIPLVPVLRQGSAQAPPGNDSQPAVRGKKKKKRKLHDPQPYADTNESFVPNQSSAPGPVSPEMSPHFHHPTDLPGPSPGPSTAYARASHATPHVNSAHAAIPVPPNAHGRPTTVVPAGHPTSSTGAVLRRSHTSPDYSLNGGTIHGTNAQANRAALQARPPPASRDEPVHVQFTIQPSVLAQADPRLVKNFMKAGRNGLSTQQQQQPMAPQLQNGNQTIPSQGGAAFFQPTNMMNPRSIPMNPQQVNNVGILQQNNMNVQYPQRIQGNTAMAVQGSTGLAPHNVQVHAMSLDPGPSMSTTTFGPQQQYMNSADLLVGPQAGPSSTPSGYSGRAPGAHSAPNQFFNTSGMLPNVNGNSANVDPNGDMMMDILQFPDPETELAAYAQIAAQSNNGHQNGSNQQWS